MRKNLQKNIILVTGLEKNYSLKSSSLSCCWFSLKTHILLNAKFLFFDTFRCFDVEFIFKKLFFVYTVSHQWSNIIQLPKIFTVQWKIMFYCTLSYKKQINRVLFYYLMHEYIIIELRKKWIFGFIVLAVKK